MHALRCINNNYSEWAGQRGDFIILGHPDFQEGKIGALPRPNAGKWDRRLPKSNLKRSPVADKVHKAGSAALIRQLTEDFPPPPRERALARSASMGAKALSSSEARVGYHQDFDKFVQAISSPELLPKFQASDRTTSGTFCNLKDFGAAKHYDSMHEEFANIADRLKRDPEGTRQFLKNTGSWKHWGLQLEHALKRESLLKQGHTHAKTSSLYALEADVTQRSFGRTKPIRN